jgi:hypothetical protein
MMHIIVGLFFIALGIWGVFDEWYYVVDCVKGGTTVLLLAVGHVAILAGVMRPKKKVEEDLVTDNTGGMPDAKEAD